MERLEREESQERRCSSDVCLMCVCLTGVLQGVMGPPGLNGTQGINGEKGMNVCVTVLLYGYLECFLVVREVLVQLEKKEIKAFQAPQETM